MSYSKLKVSSQEKSLSVYFSSAKSYFSFRLTNCLHSQSSNSVVTGLVWCRTLTGSVNLEVVWLYIYVSRCGTVSLGGGLDCLFLNTWQWPKHTTLQRGFRGEKSWFALLSFLNSDCLLRLQLRQPQQTRCFQQKKKKRNIIQHSTLTAKKCSCLCGFLSTVDIMGLRETLKMTSEDRTLMHHDLSGKKRARQRGCKVWDTDTEKGQNLTSKPRTTARRQPVRQCRRGGGWEEDVEGGKEVSRGERREGPAVSDSPPGPQSGPTLGTANPPWHA